VTQPFTVRAGEPVPLWVPLKLKDGTVVIELSDPKAAVEVRVDNHSVERAALAQPLPFGPGPHVVKVQGPGIEPVSRPFTVKAGEVVHVPLTLKPRTVPKDGTAVLELSDPNAAVVVRVDGRSVAPAGLGKGLRLAAGEHELTVDGDAYKHESKKFAIQAEKETRVQIVLEARPPLPVPPLAEVQKEQESIRKAHSVSYAQDNRAAKVALAERLRGQAEELRDNPTRRYALWQEARQQAIKAPAVTLATRIGDELARTFNVNGLDLKAAALHDIGLQKVLHTPDRSLSLDDWLGQNHQLASVALTVVDAGVAAQKFTTAFDMLQVASEAETRTKIDGSILLLRASGDEIQGLKTAFSRLQADPTSAGDNLRVGRFLCLSAGRWQVGLPLLEKAGEPLWQDAAKLELSYPKDSAGYVTGKDPKGHEAVGDAWTKLFDRAGGQDSRLGERARAWYDLALSELPASAQGAVRAKALHARRVPNLSLIKPVFDDDGANPRSALPVHQADAGFKLDSGYENGRWFMKARGGYWLFGGIHPFTPPVACQIVARVKEPHSAAWDFILGRPEQKYRHTIRIDGTGKVQLLYFDGKTEQETKVDLPSPRGIKLRGEFNTLLVVARMGQVDLYVNGVPVGNRPLNLAREAGPGWIQLGIETGDTGGTIELQRMTVWSAVGIPPLGARP
jgi:hypothetical protein